MFGLERSRNRVAMIDFDRKELTLYPTAIEIKDGNGNVIYSWKKPERKLFLPNPPGLVKREPGGVWCGICGCWWTADSLHARASVHQRVKVRQVGNHLETTR